MVTRRTVFFKCTEPLTPRHPSTLARTFQPRRNSEMRGCRPESHSRQCRSWETTSAGDKGPGPAFRGCLARQQQIVYILWPALFQNKGACAGHRALSRSGGAVPRTLLWRDTRRGVALAAVRVGQRALLPPRRASRLTGLGRTQLSRSGHKALALRARCPKPALSFLLSLLILKADPWSLCLRSAPRTPQTNRPPNGAPLCVNREVTTGVTSDWKTPPGTAG